MTTKIVASTSLYSDHGGSDKVYNVQIIEVEGGFEVHYQNGKRGGTLTPGKKTPAPVTLEKATKAYDALVKSKVNGSSHYRPIDADAGAYVAPVEGRALSGVFPMLLKPIFEEADVERYLTDDRYVMQEKHDGERLETINQAELIGSNKLGFIRGVPDSIKQPIALEIDSTFDGELVGNVFHVFDILQSKGTDIRYMAYGDRLRLLAEAAGRVDSPFVSLVKTYRTTAEKRAALEEIRQRGGEGVVFKDMQAAHQEGSVSTAIKYQFRVDATVKVHSITEGKRSICMSMFAEDGSEVVMGKVTVPANQAMPAIGSYLDVNYLYASPGTHKLIQPIFKRPRPDQNDSGCLLSKLKYKVQPAGVTSDAEPDELEFEEELKKAA